jgi:hypothetical protein
VESTSRARAPLENSEDSVRGEKLTGNLVKLCWVRKQFATAGISGFTIRLSLPLAFLPPGWSFVSVWFAITFKFFDLCTLSITLLLSPPIPVGGSMMLMPRVGVTAVRI